MPVWRKTGTATRRNADAAARRLTTLTAENSEKLFLPVVNQ